MPPNLPGYSAHIHWWIGTHFAKLRGSGTQILYSENSDKGHSERGQIKPPNKGQAESTHVYTLYRKSPLKEDNLSTKDSVLIKRFHCKPPASTQGF